MKHYCNPQLLSSEEFHEAYEQFEEWTSYEE